MTDSDREAEIVMAGAVMSMRVGLAEIDPMNYTMHMALASASNQAMSDLIRGRSAEYVKGLETARGLV